MDKFKNHTPGEVHMTKLKCLMTSTTAIMLLLGAPSWAAEQPGLGIANNDSIYVDGSSFKIVPGKGKGDASALIKKLDAHAVGSGMIIFRSGDTLYVAGASPSVIQTGGTRYGSDRDDRGGIDVGPLGQCFDPGSAACRAENLRGNNASTANARARYGSDRDTSVSAAQAERDWRDWQAFTRQNPRYGSDRDTSVSAAQAERDWQDFLRNSRFGSDRLVINDPEYAQYKLKKIFDENWTASDLK
jgi:hypothetical protein